MPKKDNPISKSSVLKTGKLQRQWAMTKASAKVGTKAASQMWLGALSDPFDKEKRRESHKRIMTEQSQALVDELGKLKGSIVKVGQMMALYGEHILPERNTLGASSARRIQ